MAERHTLQITVGPKAADISGSDNRALQAAVDYVANLGGGRVEILPHSEGVSINGITVEGNKQNNPRLPGCRGNQSLGLHSGSGSEGVLFREESEAMAGHRNRFEENRIVDNGNGDKGYGVRILGQTAGLQFVNNRIGNESSRNQQIGILVGEKAGELELEGNDISGNTETDVMEERKAAT